MLFAKMFITITVLDDACKLLKSWNRPSCEIFFFENNPLYGMAQSCLRCQKIYVEL